MSKMPLHMLDIRQLKYFAVIAEEGSLKRAAERLFLSQPPLSVHLKNLEEALGVVLFVRHKKGVFLTEDGRRVLTLIQPLLQAHERAVESLSRLSLATQKAFTVGFTTGFEQGAFFDVDKRLRALYGDNLRIVRESSHPLVQLMRKGKVDVALLALPLLDTQGLLVKPMRYAEARVLAAPESWVISGKRPPPLKAFNGKPLFRLRRDHNPGFFEFTKSVFLQSDFSSKYIEEPLEHDVLLALIASGEGMGLLPLSFTALRRDGVALYPVQGEQSFAMQPGHRRPAGKRGPAGRGGGAERAGASRAPAGLSALRRRRVVWREAAHFMVVKRVKSPIRCSNRGFYRFFV